MERPERRPGELANEITFDTGFNSGISTFDQDQNGELYFATIQGDIYRIEPLPTELPDLTVLTVDGPTDGTIGQNINVTTTTVRNVGDGDSGASRVGFYLTKDLGQPDQTFTGSTCNVPALNAGAMHTCSNTTVNVPNSLLPGDYSLAGIVDDNGVVTESDETNNDATDSNMIALSCGSSMENCIDGIDNNCDGLVDGDDPLCANACTATGQSCSSDNDCCSNKCRGGATRPATVMSPAPRLSRLSKPVTIRSTTTVTAWRTALIRPAGARQLRAKRTPKPHTT